MKKLLIVFLSFVLLMGLACPALAASSASATIDGAASANPGDSVVFTVSVSTVDDCRSGGIVLSYDRNVFEFVSGKCLLKNVFMSDFTGGTGVFAFADAANISGKVFQFTLRVKDGAPSGKTTVSGSANIRTEADALSVSVSGCSLTVNCAHSYGSWSSNDSGHRRTCSKCGYTAAKEHTYDDGKVITNATCKDPGEKTVKCTVCGFTKTQSIPKTNDHSYENACDDTCNLCGHSRKAPHSMKWKAEVSGHHRYCTLCGIKKDALSHTPGAAATETESQKCTTCGYVIQAPLGHTHHYEDNPGFDDAAHWYTCTGCAEQTQPEAHVFDHDCDEICDICGFEREISHSYGQYRADKAGHWQVCDICGHATASAAHESKSPATEEVPEFCHLCGWEVAPILPHTHRFGPDWQHDADCHWQICPCGETNPDAHLWENAACSVCGFQQEMSFWLPILIVVLLTIGVTVVVLLRRKKTHS